MPSASCDSSSKVCYATGRVVALGAILGNHISTICKTRVEIFGERRAEALRVLLDESRRPTRFEAMGARQDCEADETSESCPSDNPQHQV